MTWVCSLRLLRGALLLLTDEKAGVPSALGPVLQTLWQQPWGFFYKRLMLPRVSCEAGDLTVCDACRMTFRVITLPLVPSRPGNFT